MTQQTVLVVEDEPKIAQLLLDYLNDAGYRTRWLGDGSEVVASVRDRAPDLLLLDLMLPGKDGLSVCRELRAFSDLPIIMLTARVEEIDRLLGLELGADDYVCKPFSPREVVARVKTLLRRAARSDSSAPDARFSVDYDRVEIRHRGRPLELTPNEFRLLALLLKSPGRVYSRDRLLDELNNDGRDVSDRAIDSHIKNLRKKLAVFSAETQHIQSVYGVGYKFEP